jgi:hypothetical protein
MFEVRENLALVPETLQYVGGVEATPDDLDRNFLVVFGVVADREVYRTHPAASNLANNPVEPQVLADKALGVEKTGGNGPYYILDIFFIVEIGGEERLDLQL